MDSNGEVWVFIQPNPMECYIRDALRQGLYTVKLKLCSVWYLLPLLVDFGKRRELSETLLKS